MHSSVVQATLSKRLPRLTVGMFDFTLERDKSRVKFFCNTTTTLDYTVTLSASAPTAAAVTMLVRETDNLNANLLAALQKEGGGKIHSCLIEDEAYEGAALLKWAEKPAPLSSRPAKFSFMLWVASLPFWAHFSFSCSISSPRHPAGDLI